MTIEEQKESKLNWTNDMDNCMLGVFLDHLAQGRKTPQGWKKHTYSAVKEALKENLNADVTINHIENRMKTMRKHTTAFKNLKTSFSGSGYDPETGFLTADDLVWSDAIKANGKVKGYRNKPLPHLMEWIEVLGDSVAVGNIQKTSTTADEDANTEEPVENVYTSNNFLGDQYTIESPLEQSTQHPHSSTTADITTNGVPNSSAQSKKTTKLLPRKRSNVQSVSSGLKEEFSDMRGVMTSFVEAVKERNQSEKERNQFEKERIENEKEKNSYEDKMWDQIHNAIYAIKDMDEDTQVDALDLFSCERAENLKRCFLRVPEHKRKEWLSKKLKK